MTRKSTSSVRGWPTAWRMVVLVVVALSTMVATRPAAANETLDLIAAPPDGWQLVGSADGPLSDLPGYGDLAREFPDSADAVTGSVRGWILPSGAAVSIVIIDMGDPDDAGSFLAGNESSFDESGLERDCGFTKRKWVTVRCGVIDGEEVRSFAWQSGERVVVLLGFDASPNVLNAFLDDQVAMVLPTEPRDASSFGFVAGRVVIYGLILGAIVMFIRSQSARADRRSQAAGPAPASPPPGPAASPPASPPPEPPLWKRRSH